MQNKVTGYFDLSDWGTVAITGKDSADYLQRMSTVNLKSLDPGNVAHGTFLTGKGGLVALGMLERLAPDQFHFHVSPGQAARTAEHLEKFHFAEVLEVKDVSSQWALLGGWGLERPAAAMRVVDGQWRGLTCRIWGDDCRPALTWVKIGREQLNSARESLAGQGVSELGRPLFHYFRVAYAVPELGVEVGLDEIVLETGFDRAVARNKGCYPGQEVVERIFTYGSVNRKLLPVKFVSQVPPELPQALLDAGKNVGELVSAAAVPDEPGRFVGLAYVHRSQWERRDAFRTEKGIEVTLRAPGLE